MRRYLILLTIFANLFAAPVLAQTRHMQEIDTLRSLPDNARCFMLDARTGWQRLNLQDQSGVYLHIYGPGNISELDKRNSELARNVGWTVDRARYDRVGPLGHKGDAAAALEPYAQYKLNKKADFGTLLLRTPTGVNGHLRKQITRFRIESAEEYMDFRINDSDASLADNGGYLLMCYVPFY